jgi:hypothetical protein
MFCKYTCLNDAPRFVFRQKEGKGNANDRK